MPEGPEPKFDPFDHDEMQRVRGMILALEEGLNLLEAYNDEVSSSAILEHVSERIGNSFRGVSEYVRAVEWRTIQDLEQDGA